jgi:hypothetical protein
LTREITLNSYCKCLINFVQFSRLYTSENLDSRYLFESMARATAIIAPPNYQGYDLIIPVAAEDNRALYAGVQFKNWSPDAHSAVWKAFDSMLEIDAKMELKGMTNVLGILVQLCGKEDADISAIADGAVKEPACELRGDGVTYTLVKWSPCTRVRVYTAKETAETVRTAKTTNADGTGRKKPRTSVPNPAPLFVYVVGLAAFKSLASDKPTREIFMSSLNLRASPSQTGLQMRINSRRYLDEQTLYGDKIETAISAAIPYSHGQEKRRLLEPFHKARDLTDAEKDKFKSFQRNLKVKAKAKGEKAKAKVEKARANVEKPKAKVGKLKAKVEKPKK